MASLGLAIQINYIIFDQVLALKEIVRDLKISSLYLSLLFLLSASCKHNYTRTSQLPKKHIAIGSYGGFTGMDAKLIYLKNGQVYSSETLPGAATKVAFLKQLPKKNSINMFKAVKRMNFNQDGFAQPANINTYIEYKRRWLPDYYYQWDGILDSTDQNFKAITELMHWRD